VQRGERKGTYLVESSVASYGQHLREQAAGRGGDLGADVRARLGAAQAKGTRAGVPVLFDNDYRRRRAFRQWPNGR
jgi:hypothetical protein